VTDDSITGRDGHSVIVDKRQPKRGEIDLHGFHPHDDDLYPTIVNGLRQAYEAGLSHLTIIHGHGFNRASSIRTFVNSNTGFLGQTVRQMLRANCELRKWMLVKFDCSHEGSTTVRLRKHLDA
jgi:DNA-nicking Smr family endonuclease